MNSKPDATSMKRYDIGISVAGDILVRESADGKYVLYSDVSAHLEIARSALRENMRSARHEVRT